mmetsp:Transcript_54744/g.152779  ORF Transcript_54744/g.152779 Transcript_54744/m.152779 type:complete len:324 (+) Transcript_54744:378-1349(+)
MGSANDTNVALISLRHSLPEFSLLVCSFDCRNSETLRNFIELRLLRALRPESNFLGPAHHTDVRVVTLVMAGAVFDGLLRICAQPPFGKLFFARPVGPEAQAGGAPSRSGLGVRPCVRRGIAVLQTLGWFTLLGGRRSGAAERLPFSGRRAARWNPLGHGRGPRRDALRGGSAWGRSHTIGIVLAVLARNVEAAVRGLVKFLFERLHFEFSLSLLLLPPLDLFGRNGDDACLRRVLAQRMRQVLPRRAQRGSVQRASAADRPRLFPRERLVCIHEGLECVVFYLAVGRGMLEMSRPLHGSLHVESIWYGLQTQHFAGEKVGLA